MSLSAFTTHVIAELERARDVFGQAPRPAAWDSTAKLTSAHTVVAAQQQHIAGWRGAGADAYRGAAGPAIVRLGAAIAADGATADAMTTAAQTALEGRVAMTAIVDDTKRTVADRPRHRHSGRPATTRRLPSAPTQTRARRAGIGGSA